MRAGPSEVDYLTRSLALPEHPVLTDRVGVRNASHIPQVAHAALATTNQRFALLRRSMYFVSRAPCPMVNIGRMNPEMDMNDLDTVIRTCEYKRK